MKPRIRVAGLVIEDDSVLLVKHAGYGREWWVPPGGGLEGSESFEECVVREVREETGFDVEPRRLAYVKEFIEPSTDTHHVELFFVTIVRGGEKIIGSNADGTEFDHSIIDVRWVPEAELLNDFSERVAPEIISTRQFWESAALGFPDIEYIDIKTEVIR